MSGTYANPEHQRSEATRRTHLRLEVVLSIAPKPEGGVPHNGRGRARPLAIERYKPRARFAVPIHDYLLAAVDGREEISRSDSNVPDRCVHDGTMQSEHEV
jgi:hypothetical protein